MASKILNKDDRACILENIRKDAMAQDKENPNFKRLVEIKEELQAFVKGLQDSEIPESDRAVLLKYSAIFNEEKTLSFKRNDKGGIYESWCRGSADIAELPINVIYIRCENSSKYFPFNCNLIDYLIEHKLELLLEYNDLYVLIQCELKKLLGAWETILLKLRSSGKIIEAYPEIKKYMPDNVLNYNRQKPFTAVVEDIEVSEAENVIKSFGV